MKGEKKYPIRLIVGATRGALLGFSVVYEKEDGTAETAEIWYANNVIKIKFVDGKDGYIILDGGFVKEVQLPRGNCVW